MDMSFGGEGETSGVYHSSYGTFEHHRRSVDPGLVYDALLAKTVGRLVLRVAEAKVPVQRADGFAEAVSDYLDQVKKLSQTTSERKPRRKRSYYTIAPIPDAPPVTSATRPRERNS